MKIWAVSLVSALIGFATLQAVQEIRVVKSLDVKWVESANLPKGALMSVQYGDPAKGASLTLVKFPTGMIIPPHWHSTDEVATVVAGNAVFGMGETVDESKGTNLEAGSYIVIPAKKPHWAVVKKELIISRYASGPSDFNLAQKN